MNGEVSATESMIKSTIDCDLVTVCGKGFEQRRFLERFARCVREEMLLLKTEQVTDCDESAGARPGTIQLSNHRVSANDMGHQ